MQNSCIYICEFWNLEMNINAFFKQEQSETFEKIKQFRRNS